MHIKRLFGLAICLAMLGLGSVVGVGVYLLHRSHPPAATSPVEQDDGMLYSNAEPWQDPDPPFPLTCAHPAYCQLGVDLVCTIVYVMLDYGTTDSDIVQALRPQHDEITAVDFTDCQGFEHYWTVGTTA